MHRTTVMLPEPLKLRAQAMAEKRGVSLGELIRRALESELEDPLRGLDDDLLFSDASTFSGDTPPDLSKDHDRYLYDEP
jgi:hypothetical protein